MLPNEDQEAIIRASVAEKEVTNMYTSAEKYQDGS